MRIKKIRSKILISIIGCVLIMSFIVAGLIGVQNKINIEKEAKEKIEAQAIVNGKELNNKFVRAETIVEQLSATVKGLVDINKLKTNSLEYQRILEPVIEQINKVNKDFMGIYINFNPKITKDVYGVIFADVNDSGVYKKIKNHDLKDFDPNNTKMSWYYNPIKQNKGIWSEPYSSILSEKQNTEIISYSEPIYKNRTLIGVVGIDINYNKYVRTINNIVINKSGYAFLLNDNLNYIVHKNFTFKDNLKKIYGGKYRDIAEIISEHKSGCLEVKFQEEKKIIGYAHLTNGWIIVTSIVKHDILKKMHYSLFYTGIAFFIGLIICWRIAILLSRKISEPVVLATNFAEELASGNLEGKICITSNDEMEIMGNSLNKAGENIRNLIEELQATEEELTYQLDELRKSEETISVLAYYNSVTNLENRNYLLKNMPLILKKLKDNNQEGALIRLNIDNFNIINDTLGHRIGDEFLREVSKILKENLKEHQLLVHLGADEFVIFFSNINSIIEVEKFSNIILNIFRQAIHIHGYEIFYTTISLGIAQYPLQGNDVETLFKNADIALITAKNSGKNTYKIFNADMNLKVSEKLQLENNLRQAIDNNEFEVYYQPKVDLRTGKTLSMEALVRWISPSRGFISPDKFVPLAEEIGIINVIGEFVLREACKQNKIWHEKGFNSLKVAVNLSAKQLKQDNLISVINNILNETELEPQWLELEITESILIGNFNNAIEKLEKLKVMGINIYLDDFGTGYSSLNYLRQLPINSIKIDKSFIDEVTTNPKDSFIAASLINLAHGINLSVVAEGVETLEQLELLKSYGCDKIQGYYFSKPLNANDFELFLMQNDSK